MTFKTLNDSTGPNGLLTTLLVFAFIHIIARLTIYMADQVTCTKYMDKAGAELAKIIAASRVSQVLGSDVLSTARKEMNIGFEILAYRKKSRKREVPHQFLDLDDKEVSLNVYCRAVSFSIQQKKRYNRELIGASSVNYSDEPMDT